jgi:hypothetical protein
MVVQTLYHQCIGGTVPVPSFVIEMQTCSTNDHISQIFFVFAAPMYWWHWLAAPVLMVCLKGIVMLAAPAPIGKSMTNYWAGLRGKRNRIIPRWRPNMKIKGHLTPQSDTVSIICHLPDPPCFSLVTTYTVRVVFGLFLLFPCQVRSEKIYENVAYLLSFFYYFFSVCHFIACNAHNFKP